MSNVVYTAADINTAARELYCDLYKEIHGFKGSYTASAEAVAHFLNNYDTYFEQAMEDERRELADLNERMGQNFKTWMEYYNYLDAKEAEEWKVYEAERLAKIKFKKDFFSRFSILAAVTLWEEGAIV